MAYATLEEVIVGFPAISTLIGAGSLDVSSVQVQSYFIANAEAMVNAALRDRYVVPLAAPVDPVIRRATVDIVICDMVKDRLPKTPEFIDRRCQSAMATLTKIREGKLDIGSAEPTSNGSGDMEVWSSTQEHHPTFDPTIDPIDQTVDRDRINEQNDIRENDIGSRGKLLDDC